MKKALNIIKNVFVWALVVVAVGMMIFTVFSVNTFDNTEASIFGYKMFNVLTPSMKDVFAPGDIVVVKNVKDCSTLVKGDIITFTSLNSDDSFGKPITHEIIELTTDESGAPCFVTKGTNNTAADEKAVVYSQVLGKYCFKLVGVGTFFTFLKTTPGYIVCILLPFLLLIIMQGLNSIKLFKKYKKEQLAEINATREAEKAELEEQRKALEAEREESKKMFEELQKLKAQMTAQTQTPASEEEQKSESDSE